MEEKNNMDNSMMVCEPTAIYAAIRNDGPVLMNYDKIDDVGPKSVQELYADIAAAEREMNEPAQWTTLGSFLTDFRKTHSAWFK